MNVKNGSSHNGKRLTKDEARQIIFSQMLPVPVRHSAWVLFLHETDRINPNTGKPYTTRKALSNTLRWMEHQKAMGRIKRLSPKQMTIMHLLVHEGLSQQQIAMRLNCSLRTIKTQVAKIRKRLEVETLYQAAARAAELGFVSTPRIEE